MFVGPSSPASVLEVSRGRYPTIDVLRGLALCSMVTTHSETFTRKTLLWHAFHVQRWIDGAFLFVALSGMVTGIVHRRVVERDGLGVSRRKLLRRAALIYLVHVGLTVTILAVRSWRKVGSFGDVPTWTASGGLARGLLAILRLRLELDFNDILPMYVLFLAWAVLAVALLRRQLGWLVAVVSVIVYAFAQTTGGLALKPDSWDIGSWQLLFTAGLLVGWSWERERLDLPRVWRRRLILVAGAVWGLLFGTALVARASMEREFGPALGRLNGGWLAFAYTLAALLVAFPLIDRLWRVPPLTRPLRTLSIVGSKGLPGFATMVLAILVLDLVPSIPRNDPVNLAVMVLCGCAEYLALRRHGRKGAALGSLKTRQQRIVHDSALTYAERFGQAATQ